jgi:hypothetical protein
MQAVGLKLITKLGANLKTETKNITISRTRLDGIDAAPLDHLVFLATDETRILPGLIWCSSYAVAPGEKYW